MAEAPSRQISKFSQTRFTDRGGEDESTIQRTERKRTDGDWTWLQMKRRDFRLADVQIGDTSIRNHEWDDLVNVLLPLV